MIVCPLESLLSQCNVVRKSANHRESIECLRHLAISRVILDFDGLSLRALHRIIQRAAGNNVGTEPFL